MCVNMYNARVHAHRKYLLPHVGTIFIFIIHVFPNGTCFGINKKRECVRYIYMFYIKQLVKSGNTCRNNGEDTSTKANMYITI